MLSQLKILCYGIGYFRSDLVGQSSTDSSVLVLPNSRKILSEVEGSRNTSLFMSASTQNLHFALETHVKLPNRRLDAAEKFNITPLSISALAHGAHIASNTS
jgi:hypothetical protein